MEQEAMVLAFFLSYAGMASLGMAMDRHYAQVWQRPLSTAIRRRLRLLGCLLLAWTLIPCILAWGSSIGIVVCLGFWSVAALLLLLMLSYAARWVLPLQLFCIGLSILLAYP